MNAAAKHWRTKARVNGDLAAFCDELQSHGDEMSRDGIVDICLTAAENFNPALYANASAGPGGGMINMALSTRGDGSINWDRGLYHAAEEPNEAGREACLLRCYDILVDKVCLSVLIFLHAG